MSLTPSFLCKDPMFPLQVVDRESESPDIRELIQNEGCSGGSDASRLLTPRFRCELTARFRCKRHIRALILRYSCKQSMILPCGLAWRKILEPDLEQG